MTKKPATPPPPPSPNRPYTSLLAAALVAGAVAVVYYWPRQQTPSPQAASASARTAPDLTPQGGPAPAGTPSWAKFGPREQQTLPPLDFPGYDTPRPHDVIAAAYRFAAEHPEVLTYVPCFCGCERAGHRGNEDCFVRERATNGDVITWEPHGMECTVCIDVATRARALYEKGATVRAIHDTIDAEFRPRYPTITPTPLPR